jgi:hypothetical protein
MRAQLLVLDRLAWRVVRQRWFVIAVWLVVPVLDGLEQHIGHKSLGRLTLVAHDECRSAVRLVPAVREATERSAAAATFDPTKCASLQRTVPIAGIGSVTQSRRGR